MCARYGLTDPRLLANRFSLPGEVAGLAPRYNAAPTQRLPVIVQRGANEVEAMRWGLIPASAKDLGIGGTLINARSETVAEKPSFRRPFRTRRCLIPATHFIESGETPRGRPPHVIRLTDAPLFASAGIYDENARVADEPIRSFALLTTAPNGLVEHLHDRMPVILRPEDEAAWLDPDADPRDLHALLRPYPAEAMEAYAVSRLVNSPRVDTPEVLRPLVA